MKTEGVILGTSKQDSFGLKHMMVSAMFWMAPRQGKCTFIPCLCSPVQHDREEARNCKKGLLGQVMEIALNDGIMGEGDFNTSACRERGKAKLSSIEEAWEKMLLILPPDLVPMLARWRTQETVVASY